jgi:hypothetical protein
VKQREKNSPVRLPKTKSTTSEDQKVENSDLLKTGKTTN